MKAFREDDLNKKFVGHLHYDDVPELKMMVYTKSIQNNTMIVYGNEFVFVPNMSEKLAENLSKRGLQIDVEKVEKYNISVSELFGVTMRAKMTRLKETGQKVIRIDIYENTAIELKNKRGIIQDELAKRGFNVVVKPCIRKFGSNNIEE